MHSSSGRNEVIPKNPFHAPLVVVIRSHGYRMLWGEQCLFPASTALCSCTQTSYFGHPASSVRAKVAAIRRCSGADLVPYLPCAVCSVHCQLNRLPLARFALFCALSPFPAEKILYSTHVRRYDGTTLQPVVSWRPATVISRHVPIISTF